MNYLFTSTSWINLRPGISIEMQANKPSALITLKKALQVQVHSSNLFFPIFANINSMHWKLSWCFTAALHDAMLILPINVVKKPHSTTVFYMRKLTCGQFTKQINPYVLKSPEWFECISLWNNSRHISRGLHVKESEIQAGLLHSSGIHFFISSKT